VSLQSWMIKSWPTCEWYLPPNSDDWPLWWHMNTQVREHRDAAGRCIGDTVWMANIEGRSVAATWEWTEVRQGVVVLSDPNSILSNLRFILSESSGEEQLAAAIALNRVVNVLPWQPVVCAVLRTLREYPGAGGVAEFARGRNPRARPLVATVS